MAVLNLTEKQKNEQIDFADIKKMQQEKQMANKLNALFNKIASDFKIFYTATGMVPNLQMYLHSMQEILMNGYRNSASYFKNNLKRQLQISLNQEKNETKKKEIQEVLKVRRDSDAAILAALLLLFNSRRDQQARLILDTTQKVISKHVQGAIMDDPNADHAKIADTASKKIKDENLNRTGTIAETETQWGAESSKDTEEDTLTKKSLGAGIVLTAIKTWIAFIDDKTRAAHVVANGQKRPARQPYNVGGELLMHPGDTSLGASAGNIVNCRCQSFVSI
jgi:hypothetical protein